MTCTCLAGEFADHPDYNRMEHQVNCPVYESPLTYDEIRQLRAILNHRQAFMLGTGSN